jgi:cytoskeletal protein CcmA (bactofilin family)
VAFWDKKDEAEEPPELARAPEATAGPSKAKKELSMAMLKRDDEMAGRSGGELNALLGRGSEFEGKLTFEGTVRIDGKFSGEIHTNDVLVIGEGAKVNAEISAGSVVVNGEVQGNIKAKTSIELHQPAKVRGNLETPALSIDKGVIFEGSAKMEQLSQGAAKPGLAAVAAPTPFKG